MKIKFGFLVCGVVGVSMGMSSMAYSWGDQGHIAVAMVAKNVLEHDNSPQAKKTVEAMKAILGDLSKIGDAAIWPDKVKTLARECKDDFASGDSKKARCDAYKYTASWHYINTSKKEYALQDADWKGDVALVTVGLAHLLKGQGDTQFFNLSSFKTWKAQCIKAECKAEALKFLIHFIGDIHQPLHAGADCDEGGNSQYVTYFGQADDPNAWWCEGRNDKNCWHYELHQIWDANLILKEAGVDKFEKINVEDFVEKLLADASLKQPKVTTDGNACVTVPLDSAVNLDDPKANGPVRWINESICYLPQVYTFTKGDGTSGKGADKGAPTRARSKVAQGLPKKHHQKGGRANASVEGDWVANRCFAEGKVPLARGVAYAAVPAGPRYFDVNIRTVHERIYWAGVRLASLLKEIYGDGDKAKDL